MPIRVSVHGGLNPPPAGRVADVGRRVTVLMPILASGGNRFDGGLGEDINTEIAQTVYRLVLIEHDDFETLRQFDAIQRGANFKSVLAHLIVQAELRWGQIPILPEGLRRWIYRIEAEGDALIDDGGGLIKVRMAAAWLTDP